MSHETVTVIARGGVARTVYAALRARCRGGRRAEDKSFLICSSQHDFCAIADGPDASAAVGAYYDGMGGLCGAADQADFEQEPMDVYEIPGSTDADVARLTA